MSGYRHDESAPTPDGVFATNFVGVRWCFAECFTTNFVVDVGNWRSVRNQFRGGRGELAECSQPTSWVLRKHSPNVCNVFAICLIYIRKMFATC